MLRNIIGPLFTLKIVFFCCFFLACFSKILFFLQGERDFWKQKKQKRMDHFLTLKRPKIGPLFNLQHIYIYIFISSQLSVFSSLLHHSFIFSSFFHRSFIFFICFISLLFHLAYLRELMSNSPWPLCRRGHNMYMRRACGEEQLRLCRDRSHGLQRHAFDGYSLTFPFGQEHAGIYWPRAMDKSFPSNTT